MRSPSARTARSRPSRARPRAPPKPSRRPAPQRYLDWVAGLLRGDVIKAINGVPGMQYIISDATSAGDLFNYTSTDTSDYVPTPAVA